MVVQVNQELCDSCGVCMEACSVGAIQLVDQRAVIDEALCTRCEACVDACPKGAIIAILEPAQLMPTMALTVTETQMIPAPTCTALLAADSSNRGLAPLAGAALAFLGRQVAPRLVDVLVTALERRLERPITTPATPSPTSSRVLTTQSRGKRRQARYRSRRRDKKNHQERR
jgi:Fe-S-cluster-containing hydrogenase component 2